MAGPLKREQLILYVFITVTYLLFWIHTDLASHPGQFAISLVNNGWQVVYVIGVNLVYFEFILPVVTARKTNRLLTILAGLFLHLVVFILGLFAWRTLGMRMTIYQPFTLYTDLGEAFSDIVRFTPGSFILFAAFKLFVDYTQLKYEGQQARLEKKQAELVFLKSQINPHFLFNTLNNIYSLSHYQPQLVSESILRLSKLLRYLLYETGSELIAIDKELKIMNDYIDLEKLRYNESVTIDVHYAMEDPSEEVPPLLLLPLVENAFKHGIAESRGKRFVHVTFTLQNRHLCFTVVNSSNSTPEHGETKATIGLPNLRRRLNLLYKDFDLVTGQKDGVFAAHLTINLSSHV